MIRTNVWMMLLAGVLLTAVNVFAQSSDRLPVTDAGEDRRRIARRPRIHHQGRDCPRLAIVTRRRISCSSQRIERMDLPAGHSRVFPRRDRLLRPDISSVDAGQPCRPYAAH